MHQTFNKLRRFSLLFKYLSFSKCLNFVRLGVSYSYSVNGKQKTNKLSPTFLSVETANYCNLHCPECPVGKGIEPRPERAKFDLTLYKKLIDVQKKTLLHVILYFQGEPLLNKQLTEFIAYAHEAKIYTSTSTNGQLLNSKTAKELVISGLDKLIISIDGSTQETYESYRIGGSLHKALNGVKELVFWKNKLNSATPLIEIQCIVLKTNEHQLSDMKRLTEELGADRLQLKTAQLYNYENGNKLLTSLDKYARYKLLPSGKYEIKNKQRNRCLRLWSGAVINAQGEVLPCCFDKASDYSFGNINQQSFLMTWQNKKASEFRESVLQNRKQFEICRNCTN